MMSDLCQRWSTETKKTKEVSKVASDRTDSVALPRPADESSAVPTDPPADLTAKKSKRKKKRHGTHESESPADPISSLPKESGTSTPEPVTDTPSASGKSKKRRQKKKATSSVDHTDADTEAEGV